MKNLFLCHLRGYIAHVSFSALIYSYVIQAFYRLVGTIFYHRIAFRHLKLYTYAIFIEWSFSLLQTLPIELGNNQIFIESFVYEITKLNVLPSPFLLLLGHATFPSKSR